MNFKELYTENAEHLHDILPENVQPTLIIMNPPFSSSAGRMRTNSSDYGKMHIESALKRLENDGHWLPF